MGEYVIDLKQARQLLFKGPILSGTLGGVFAAPTLNGFMALGRPAWREARHALQEGLHKSVRIKMTISQKL